YFRDNIGAYDSMYTLLALALIALAVIWLVVVSVESKKTRSWKLDHKHTVDDSLAAGANRCRITGEFKTSGSANCVVDTD
ncbi:hypothetical protein MTO96_044051, partial [Rhipicephalus appendiculatus]